MNSGDQNESGGAGDGNPPPEPPPAPPAVVKAAKPRAPKVELVGNPDAFQVLNRTKAGDVVTTTRAMHIPYIGCVVQVTTVAGEVTSEALTFVPQVKIVEDVNGGRKLEPNRA